MRQIFVCLLMSHNSCRLSSLFFLFSKNVQECSLFSSNWIISKILSSTLQVLSLAVSCLLFMFCLLHFSFHLMYYLPPESVWSFFLKFLSLYWTIFQYFNIQWFYWLFCSCLGFLVSLNCLFWYLLIAHQISLKQLFWIPYWTNCRYSFLWGWLLKKNFFFCGVMFPWLFA